MVVDAAALREWQHAAQLFSGGHHAEAGAILQALLRRDPANAQAWLALARVDIASGLVQPAFKHADAAAQHAPADAALLIEIAITLMTVGAMARARECVARAQDAAPTNPALLQRIGLQWQTLNEHDAALALMQRAHAAGLADASSRFCLAVQLMFHGRNDEAAVEFEACTTATPPLGRAWAQLSLLRRQTREQNHLDQLTQALQRVAPASEDHAAIDFARYKELEDCGRYAEAWDVLVRANRGMRAILRYDRTAEARTISALQRFVAALPRPRDPAPHTGAGPMPIFIVGMPRSGTSLLDRMLGNHRHVRSVGELGTFRRSLERVADRFTGQMLDEALVERLPRVDFAALGELYLHNSQWLAKSHAFYIDKLPRNWLLVPLIRRALPHAPILHIVRNPMDTAFSNLRSYFGPDYPYSYDMDDLAHHCRLYRSVMAHWHAVMPGAILDVSYAELVSDPEGTLRNVFAYCGLPWQAGCSDLARNHEPVATLSATQVRTSVQKGFVEQWRPYANHLSGLRALLAPNNDGAAGAR